MSRIFSQGDRENTGNELDLAIDGDGFFQVEKPGGETLYTRDGSFKRNRDGNVVTVFASTESGDTLRSAIRLAETAQRARSEPRRNLAECAENAATTGTGSRSDCAGYDRGSGGA